MKSMKYKIDNLQKPREASNKESTVINLAKLESIPNKSFYVDDEDDDVFDDEAIENEQVIIESNEPNVVIMSSSSTSTSSEIHENRQTNSAHSDTTSSNESGFGTDDQESNPSKQTDSPPAPLVVCNQINSNQYTPLQQNQQINLNQDNLPNQINSNQNKQQQQIKIPNIQGPRQIIYQLNNNSDDIANILNDNSSINSSSSSNNRLNHCCASLMEKLNKCYYSCFCCYSTTSNTHQTPFIWSWLSVFCCCCPILGCISLYLTNRSKKFKLKHKYDLAEKYSNYAEKLNIASLIFGVIFYAILFFLICIFIFMHWRNLKN